MPKFRLRWSRRSRRIYSQLPDKLKQEVINALKELEMEGVEVVANPLYRELQDRYKYKFNGFRLILKSSDDVIDLLEIRFRDHNTYLNVP